METISILHISDLHRTKGHEISNQALLMSLIKDRDKYSASEPQKIKTPDLIIVSGDIIRGSSKIVGSEDEIREQYDEAIEFLNALTTEFLSGDKSRIIVIPGNHDVDFKLSKESMTKIDQSEVFDKENILKWDLLKASINHNSDIRWSWKDLSFYRITDNEKYRRRLEAFCTFYHAFYEGQRHYSLDPGKQFDIFDYPSLGVTIAAFCSCYCNDHLRFIGDIHPNCIANADAELRHFQKKGRLILGTWHHNTKGPPYDSNYMESARLKNFIDAGISLGFHGHQHKTELIHDYSNVIEQKRLLVFSAGTLCGGEKELPIGTNRQYNIVEISEGAAHDSIDVTLHVRQKTESSSLDNPIWVEGSIDSMLVSHCTFSIEKPKQSIIETNNALIDAEQLLHTKKFAEAKERLLKLDPANEFVRKFVLEIVIATEDFSLAIDFFQEPKSEPETITFLNALIQLSRKDLMLKYLYQHQSQTIQNTAVRDLIKKIEVLTK